MLGDLESRAEAAACVGWGRPARLVASEEVGLMPQDAMESFLTGGRGDSTQQRGACSLEQVGDPSVS